MAASDASGNLQIAADPDRVYDLITDLDVLAELADEVTSMAWTKGSAAAVGAVFRGSNRNGLWRWSTTCTVTIADPGRCFAFDVNFTLVPIARWQYDIEPTADGCVVTERTWDRRPPGSSVLSGVATGRHDRGAANARHIEATLRRLKSRAESR